jgi:hypothetical protein
MEHPECEIQSDHIETTTSGEIPTDLSGPTADVEDSTDTGEMVGNGVEYGSVDRKRVEVASEGGNIVVCHRVISRTHGPRVERIHGGSLVPDDRPIQPWGDHARATGICGRMVVRDMSTGPVVRSGSIRSDCLTRGVGVDRRQ